MASVKLMVKPFDVPEEVGIYLPAGNRQDGIQSLPKLKLKDLSDETLAELIEEFTANVMAIARPE